MKNVASLALSSILFALSPFAVTAAEPVPQRPANMRINVQNDMPTVGDFTVGPARTFLEIPAGEERVVEIQITNREGGLATYSLTTEDFDADAEREGTPVFYASDLEGAYPARGWITPETMRFELRHAERAFLRVTIKVPEDADAGDHQAALVFTRETKSDVVGGFQIIPRVASLFIITVPGDVVEEGYITRLQSRHYLNWSFPVTLNLAARNTGTVHMAPEGSIVIRNIFGITVDEIPVRDWYILRNSARQRDFFWEPLFGLGYYNATADLMAFDRRPLEPVSAGFWVIPLLPVLILLFLIFIVSFLVQYLSARFEITRKTAKAEKGKKRMK
jgi:hypothetical protein